MGGFYQSDYHVWNGTEMELRDIEITKLPFSNM
jgi:hypothetical protein